MTNLEHQVSIAGRPWSRKPDPFCVAPIAFSIVMRADTESDRRCAERVGVVEPFWPYWRWLLCIILSLIGGLYLNCIYTLDNNNLPSIFPPAELHEIYPVHVLSVCISLWVAYSIESVWKLSPTMQNQLYKTYVEVFSCKFWKANEFSGQLRTRNLFARACRLSKLSWDYSQSQVTIHRCGYSTVKVRDCYPGFQFIQHHSGALSTLVRLNATSTPIPDSNKGIIWQLVIYV